ncbi:hypothetical protein JCM11641_005596 [Rhodosporidiobolus odoratus]
MPVPPAHPPGSPPSTALPTPKRPPRRVSDLVSHFETTSTPSTTVSLPSAAGKRTTPHLPRHSDVVAPSPGRVQRRVRRFSADPGVLPEEDESGKQQGDRAGTRDGRGIGMAGARESSEAFAAERLEEMDWTPRLAPSASTPALSATSAKPPPTLSASTSLPSTSASSAVPSPPRPSAPARSGKTPAAATILVPAIVSVGAEGETRLAVAPALRGTAKMEGQVGDSSVEVVQEDPVWRDEPAEDDDVLVQGEAINRPLIPPLPASPPSRPRLDLRRPSIAFVEATPPRRAAQRSTSAPATSNSLLRPLSLSRPPPTRSRTVDPTSSPSSRHKRPPFPPAIISTRSDSTFPTASTFSVPPTPSSGCTSTATRALPAYRLFARDAAPLVLPDLDRVLDDMGGAAVFSPMPATLRLEAEGEGRRGQKDEEWELTSVDKGGGKGKLPSDEVSGSTQEREEWEKWVRGEPKGWWSRLFHPTDPAAEREEQRRRSLVFPPFHLLPPELTVADLKANRRKPPPLLSLQSLVLKASNGLVGAASSSWGINMTTIEGLRDLMQMVNLLVTAASPTLSTLVAGSQAPTATESTTLFRTFVIAIPSFLSFDFVSAFGQALLLLFLLTGITFLALYEFYRFTGGWAGPLGNLGRGKLDLGEGFDREDLQERKRSFRASYAWKVGVTFWCTSIYLPLSKLAIGALLWTDDYWTVTNPYKLYESDNPSPPSLGPPNEYYAPLDFCWKTTMKRRDGLKNLNWALIIVALAVVVVLVLSVWLPWRLFQVVQQERPRVDGYTELGERRRDLNGEYERMLDIDPSPYNFLYSDYRRQWASFRSLYLFFKLASVLLVVTIDKNNCAFRSFSTTYLSIARQGCLLALLGGFFVLSAWSSPYLDIPSNSSDLASRVGYTLLAMLGLLAAMGFSGTDGAVVATNVVLYSLSVYFALISFGWSQRLVKRFQRRLDFSVDIFSPRIDLAKHLSRRVWQESIAALFLCSAEFAMSPKRKLAFTKDEELPPYLLGFEGTVAERFVENLKILREIGLDAYADAVSYRDLPSDSRVFQLRNIIQHRFTGPDMFYDPADSVLPVTSFFGRVDIIPFPFIVLFRYDQQPTQPLYLVNIEDLERLVQQNGSASIVGRRKVRLALRALEGQVVHHPYVEVRQLGVTGGADIERHIHYRSGTLRIDRNSSFCWQNHNCSSGFDVTIQYADGDGVDRDGRHRLDQRLTLPGPDFGVFDGDYTLNQVLATLFRENRSVIEHRLPRLLAKLHDHRRFFRYEAERKHRALSHSFLLSVFAEDQSTSDLEELLRATEQNPKIQAMATLHHSLFLQLEERMAAVKASDTRGWWYLCWDDLWRRNTDISGLANRPQDFSPHYRTSICYHPMSRADLEAFLHARGFTTSGRTAFFHTGFLNQLYFYLDEQIFGTTSRAIPIHLGTSPARVPFVDLTRALSHQHLPPSASAPAALMLANDSVEDVTFRKASGGSKLSQFTVDTGGATNENDGTIRQRPAFLFEEAYERPMPSFRSRPVAWLRFQLGARLLERATNWFALNPLVSDWRPSEEEEVLLDLRRGKAGWELPRGKKRKEGGERVDVEAYLDEKGASPVC